MIHQEVGMVTVVQYQQHPLGDSHHQKDHQEAQNLNEQHQSQQQEQQQQQQHLENYQYNDVHDVGSQNEDNYRIEVVSSAPVQSVVGVPTTSSNTSIGGGSTLCSEVDENEDKVYIRDNGDDDDDDEDEEDESDLEDGEWVADLPVSRVIQQQQVVANGDLVLPSADPSAFGDVCVKNSTNVHLGNKTFYKGPVTIKQFVYTNPASIQDVAIGRCDGISARISDANASDLSTSKGDAAADRPILSQNPDFDKVTQWLWTWRCAALLCTLALMLVTAVVISSVLLTRNSDSSPAPIFPEIPDSSLEGVIVSNVRFVERNEWGAQPPTEPLTKLKLPVPYVIISHTVTEFCTTQSQCTFHVRFAQTFHIESRKWSDIAYNFLVGGDGLAYVGRSWDYVGAHSFGYNNRSIGISFIGTFNSVIPPKIQLHAAQRIIELGVEAGKIAPDYKLLGHRQISKTLSPGDALYSIIKKWPHWSPQP